MATETDAWAAAIQGVNAGYVLEAHERYLADPGSVDPSLRVLFSRAGPPSTAEATAGEANVAASQPSLLRPRPSGVPGPDAAAAVEEMARLIAAAGNLAAAIREYGHRAARLDPLGDEPEGDPGLLPETHQIHEADLEHLPASATPTLAAPHARHAREAIEALRQVYCGTTGYDYDQVQAADERAWLRDASESRRFWPPNDPINERGLLERLSEVGAFERYLHRTFPGQTRFSVEGTGMLIPMLDEIIGAAAESGTRAILIGMAHRGRLNVLAHVLRKPLVEVLAEFRHPAPRPGVSSSGSSGRAFSGDVKYHLGARRNVQSGQQVGMAVTLAPNPSHLEFVNPVVEGMARAADERRDQPGPPIQDETASLPLLIHGDAAFPGQGVVAETLNLSRLPGFRTGGTLHIITNNQLGFTVVPSDGRSTLYASDLAKGFEVPIIHVNADDPVACIAAARLAHAYREQFHRDFLIDLVGYRRWGHNEGDDPSFTQPRMYARIAQHPTVRELWAAELVRRSVVAEEEVAAMLARYTTDLQEAMAQVSASASRPAVSVSQDGQETDAASSSATGDGQAERDDHPLPSPQVAGPALVETGLPLQQLRALNTSLYALPAGFAPHPRLERLVLSARRGAFEPRPDGTPPTIDWGHAEALALASILAEGTPVRLTGQDVGRGTFSQRHAVLHDYETGVTYVPLQRLDAARASFEVRDSPLSEGAVLGFEYGYSVQAPDALVVWEAQYGDFVNSAQVIVDQFIVSAWAKWRQEPSLVLLLPHGYEGQGPEHSSARLERFLEEAAENNIRVANCTTSAQYFHLLRRQARLLHDSPRPLVVMTPKSLLRLPVAASPLAALQAGTFFQPVLDDPYFAAAGPAWNAATNGEVPAAATGRGGVRRLILCSGKVYADLVAGDRRAAAPWLAIARVEELYPFPESDLAGLLERYPGLNDLVWLQEEPRNMGAWRFMRPRLQALLERRGLSLRYVGRPERASPSEGTHVWHLTEQGRIVAEAYTGRPHSAPPTDGETSSAAGTGSARVTGTAGPAEAAGAGRGAD